MDKVSLNKVKLFGYHGCLQEEEHTGANFILDADMFLDLTEAAQTDDLSKTVDYERAIFVMQEAFAKRTKLIEHSGLKIIEALKAEFPLIKKVVLTIHKPSAPISADFESVSITLEG